VTGTDLTTRDDAIRAALAAGADPVRLGEHYGLSPGRIYQIARATPRSAAAVDDGEIVDAEIVDAGVMPARRELILLGRVAMADIDHNPDDWVEPDTDRELHDGVPQNTRTAYTYQWGRWIWWCGRKGREHCPATPGSVRQYIKEHWDMVRADGRKRGWQGRPYAPASVEQAVYVISAVHQWFGYASPTKHPSVGLQLKTYERKWRSAGYRERKAYALTPEDSVAIARTCSLATVAGLRNAAAFRLQYDMGARASELLGETEDSGAWHGLRVRDVRWESPDYAVIHIAQTKTNESRDVAVEATRWVVDADGNFIDAAGQVIPLDAAGEPTRPRVPHPDVDVDPLVLLRAWYDLLVARGEVHPDAPFFRQVASTGQRRKDGSPAGSVLAEPWSYDQFAKEFTRCVQRAGVHVDPVTGEPRHITSHSNRAGLITAAVDAGVPAEVLRLRTGHAAGSRVLQGYYRSGRKWGRHNPGTVIRRVRRRNVS
jgi:integrase